MPRAAATEPRFRERAELLDFLLEVYAATSETIDLERLLANVAEIINRVVPYQLFAIFLANERRKTLRIRHAIGHREELVRSLELTHQDGIVGAVAAHRRPELVGDVRRDPRYLPSLDAIRTELAVPMMARGKLVGVIDLQSTQDQAYTDQDLALLTVLAARVASSIDNARLHRRVARNNQALRILTELSREISSILSLDELLRRIATAVRNLIAYDAFAILAVDEKDGVLRHLISQRYDERVQPDSIPLGKGVTGAAVAAKHLIRVDDVTVDERYISTHPGIHSELAVPLVVQNKVLGVLDLESEQLGFFTEEHARLMTLLAPSIAVSLENARLYEALAQREKAMESDLLAARRLQKVLLPVSAPEIAHVETAIGFRPAREISGDIFDFFDHGGDATTIAFGDSSGKGAAAALYGAMVTGLLRSWAPRRRGPAMLMRALNDALVERKVDAQYVTLVCALWDASSNQLVLANAGGFPPVVCRDGKLIRPKLEGVPLGLLEHQEYEETVFQALPGDVIVFYSDGIEDQPNAAQDHYGARRFSEFLPKIAQRPAADIVKAIEADIDKFRGAVDVHDDQSLIVMKVQ